MAQLIKIFCVFCCFSFLLTGCGSEQGHADLNKLVADLKKQEVKVESLLSEFQLKKAKSYEGQPVRNPFPEPSSTKEISVDSESPLEQYPLDTLNLLGIIQQGIKYTAVILAPDAKMYQVNVGDKMGASHGVVKQITATQVVVSEPVNSELGQVITRTKVLQLKEQ